MNKYRTNKFIFALLLLIVLVALYVRIIGITFGLPDLLHPDEGRIILDTMSMAQRMSPIPEDINYPLFHKYLLLISYGIYFLIGLASGFFKDKTDFAVKFLQDPSSIIFISRMVTSIVGTLTVVVAYNWGKIINKSKIAGLIAALFVALEWQLVFESQFAIHQTLSGVSSLLAFLGMSMMCMDRSKRSYIVGGLTIGFAVASHQTTVLLFPAILFLFITDISRKNSDRNETIKNWLVYSIFAVAIGTIGNLNWIFRFDRSLNFFLQGSGAGKVAFSSAPFFSYNVPSIILWFYSELVRRDYFIGVMVFISIIASLFRRKKIDVIYIITSVTYFIFFYQWTYRWMHLFMGLLPISTVMAAREFYFGAKKIKIRTALLLCICILLIIPNVVDILKADKQKTLPETRQMARAWIIENIPENAKIAVDYPAYSVSLPSLYPTMLRNRVARSYFDSQVPSEVRRSFLSNAKKQKAFDVVDMIDSKPDPEWPEDMPQEVINKASKNATMRDVYSYFNFKPINELIKGGVKYFVINSYTYGMALTNDDPRKTFLMNYYLKDDVNPFAYNTDKIYPNTQHEFIYYMIKRERDYFLQLLDNKIKGVSLIKEFYPNDNLGPVVKIYRVD